MNPCILIPAYNEERSITSLINSLKNFGCPVLLVDDGSTDKTALLTQNAGAKVLRNEKNQGKGASLKRGFEWAKGLGYDAFLLMDADGQHSPSEVCKFLDAARSGADIAVGNRLFQPGKMPPLRLWTNRFLSYVTSLLAGQKVYDSQCGFRLVTRKVLDSITLTSNHFEIEQEILIRASRAGFKIRSIPIESVYGKEASHIQPLRDTWRFLKFAARMMVEERDQSPPTQKEP